MKWSTVTPKPRYSEEMESGVLYFVAPRKAHRQEDLVHYLQEHFEDGVEPDEFLDFRIDLSPRQDWQR